MSILVGDAFDNWDSEPDRMIDSIPSYEILEDGLVRIFVCKTLLGKRVLDHTDVMTTGKLVAIGKRLLEIAEEVSKAPKVGAQSEDRKLH
jgi:hypothetical protein